MQENFAPSLKFVLVDEGGNDDDPQDHGGRTSRGITQREYDSYCRIHSTPRGDVWKATDETIAAIYHVSYWNPYCDAIPAGLDYVFFDASVNEGQREAVEQFQQAVNVRVDGHYGIVTHDAILNAPDKERLILSVMTIRRNWYHHLRQFPHFGPGWMNRCKHVEDNARALFRGKVTHGG